MANEVVSAPSKHPSKLTEEPGFLTMDLSQPDRVLPVEARTPGLLAYLYVEENVSEMVLRLLMLDDLAKGFLTSRTYCGRANFVAYRVFPVSGDWANRMTLLAERLKVFAQLTEKYRVDQIPMECPE